MNPNTITEIITICQLIVQTAQVVEAVEPAIQQLTADQITVIKGLVAALTAVHTASNTVQNINPEPTKLS